MRRGKEEVYLELRILVERMKVKPQILLNEWRVEKKNTLKGPFAGHP